MSNPADAYDKTAKMAATDPRELEASLLIKAAARMQRLRDNWEKSANQDLLEVLLYNRKLWSVFAASAVETEHPLPLDIKQNIANIAVFIFKHTQDIEIQPTPEKLDSLININRQIAAGLFGRSGESLNPPGSTATA